ncbi:FAD dependent oxidoreductase family protein, partial [Chlamydia psittaci 84-8471/1]
MRIAVL